MRKAAHALLVLLPLLSPDLAACRSFVVQNNSFILDGSVFQVRAGSMHYSRIPRAYWRDRLERLQALGLNAVTTYVPWNWHEETEGDLNFAGDRDVESFVGLAQEVGLLVLLRAGPYVCGEWEFGGFPAWVLRHNVTLRTYEDNYIRLVDAWWAALLPRMRPLLYALGGPIVMVQVENEYGSYGNVLAEAADKKYMQHLVSLANALLGPGAVVLYTTDGGNAGCMGRGSLPGSSVLTLGDGGWACEAQAAFNPAGLNACMNSEDYTGWLTHWGEGMANTSASDYGVVGALKSGRSFNLYMAHGGSNFGWFSGANGGGRAFQPHVTSYDYGAPIGESGAHGFGKDGRDKFSVLREALLPWAPPSGFRPEPPPMPRKAYGPVRLTRQAPMLALENLQRLVPSGPHRLRGPVNMESLGQNYGFIYYVARAARPGANLTIQGYPRDRAQVFINGVYNGAVYRPEAAPLVLRTPAVAGSEVGLLVENMGRLNFDTEMYDPKGITTPVLLDGDEQALVDWHAWSLPLDISDIGRLPQVTTTACDAAQGPTFLYGALDIDSEPCDTYVKPRNFTKGIVWVNGHHLGRFWEPQGPQHALYVPAPYLKRGPNNVTLLELERGSGDCSILFDEQQDFSGKPYRWALEDQRALQPLARHAARGERHLWV